MKFRDLSEAERRQLENNGCICREWHRVKVKEGFIADNIRNVVFSGDIKIGVLRKTFYTDGGVPKYSGIYNASIHNCIIGDDVYINQVKNHLANYIIENDVVIESVDSMAVTEKSSFGNGCRIAVLKETGGREVVMYDELSAHTAYLMAFYRHRPALVQHLMDMADAYAESVSSAMGRVGQGAHLINSRTIINVSIGPFASIEGVYRLTNGTINSCEEDPAYIGPGVIAQNFICSCGSIITDMSMVTNCFVGQGTVLGKQYSAENSVFFANCQGFHGEACSIFAGPYTVSHHKSTLLIAGYYSFLNAGSGSNQSNHMYKLGPIHQGVLERGSKTTSDSYVLWPAKIGAFTLVMGRHYRNPDTSDLPFSYIIENTDESFLAPAVNLRSIGTIRDAQKWPKRDRRKARRQPDSIVFNLLSPYSIQKIVRGIAVLKDLQKTSGPASEYFMYNGVKITASALERGLSIYRLGLIKFLGNGLVKKLELADYSTEEEMREVLRPEGKTGTGEWIDVAGLLVPKEVVLDFVDAVESGEINTIDNINDYYRAWKDNYFVWAWNWIVVTLKAEMKIDVSTVTRDEVSAFVEEWRRAVVSLDEMMYSDAKKEFTLKSQTGFGIDGEAETKAMDFENVRGEFSKHPAVRDIIEHIEKKSALAAKVQSKLEAIRVADKKTTKK